MLTGYDKRWDTIWRLDLKDERHPLAPPVRLLSGRGFIWKPSYSPDGKKIAFESEPNGLSEHLDVRQRRIQLLSAH